MSKSVHRNRKRNPSRNQRARRRTRRVLSPKPHRDRALSDRGYRHRGTRDPNLAIEIEIAGAGPLAYTSELTDEHGFW